MKTGKGVVGISLALGALLVSSANTRTAEARSSALAVAAPSAEQATTPTIITASDASTNAAEPRAAEATVGATSLAGEVVTPPRLLENPKLRRMQKGEISPALQQVAAQIVRKHHAKPVGTQVEVEVEGRRVYARIERHFHPEGGPLKPWGFHPGVSLFCER